MHIFIYMSQNRLILPFKLISFTGILLFYWLISFSTKIIVYYFKFFSHNILHVLPLQLNKEMFLFCFPQ